MKLSFNTFFCCQKTLLLCCKYERSFFYMFLFWSVILLHKPSCLCNKCPLLCLAFKRLKGCRFMPCPWAILSYFVYIPFLLCNSCVVMHVSEKKGSFLLLLDLGSINVVDRLKMQACAALAFTQGCHVFTLRAAAKRARGMMHSLLSFLLQT